MSHARLTHPTRPTLEFYGGQQSEHKREAVASVTAELASSRDTDRLPLVHTETRDIRYTERGTTTGRRRASNDPDTSDARQALANYAVELESHVDELQGDGYTYRADQTGVDKSAIIESVEWSLTPGRTYELDYEAQVIVGHGVYGEEPLVTETVTPGAPFDAMLRLDGVELPGMRDYRVTTSVGVDVTAKFDRDSAEDNEIIPQEGGGRQRNVTFEGVHTGTRTARSIADRDLRDRLATRENILLETAFPGYEIDGYLVNYESTFQQDRAFGDAERGAHRYRVEFVEGQRA